MIKSSFPLFALNILCRKCETVVASVCGENNIFCFFKITFICSSWQDVSVFKCLMVEILTWSDVEIFVWLCLELLCVMKIFCIKSNTNGTSAWKREKFNVDIFANISFIRMVMYMYEHILCDYRIIQILTKIHALNKTIFLQVHEPIHKTCLYWIKK